MSQITRPDRVVSSLYSYGQLIEQKLANGVILRPKWRFDLGLGQYVRDSHARTPRTPRDYDAEVKAVLDGPERNPYSKWADVLKIRWAQSKAGLL